MRRLAAAVVLVASLTAPSGAFAGPLALAPGDRAPLLSGRSLSGERITVSFDTLTVVNFWATWCEPCIREMPALEGLFRASSDDGLQVVGVVHEAIGPSELMAFVKRMGVTYPMIKPRPRTSGDWGGVATLPTSFLIDDKGTILRRYVGATPEQIDAMVSDVQGVLVGRPLGPMLIPDKPDVANPEDRPKAGN